MKSSLVILVIGGALLAAGLVIAGLSTYAVAKELLEDAVIIDKAPIEPGLSYGAVLKDLPAGRQLALSLSGEPSDVPLGALLTDPDGNTVVMYNITKTPFTSTVATETAGDHTFDIKNVGTRAVVVSGGVFNSPVPEQDGGVNVQDPAVQSFFTYGIGGIIVGIVLVIAGIVLLIIGAIKHLRTRKSTESMPR
ncbi:MAG: hypothetical protein ACREAQ_01640 [Nitrososphaera sp.]